MAAANNLHLVMVEKSYKEAFLVSSTLVAKTVHEAPSDHIMFDVLKF